MKRLSCAMLVLVLVLSGVCGALAVTPITIETEYLPDYEKGMYAAFIGGCMVNNIVTGEDALTPSVETEDDPMTVRFAPLDGVLVDFDFSPGYLFSVSLILDTNVEYVQSNASTLYVVFVTACSNPEMDSETVREIMDCLFDNLNYDADYGADYADYSTSSESYILVNSSTDVMLSIYPAG